MLQTRRQTRTIQLGNKFIGGKSPVTVQSMTKTDTRDVLATVAQIKELSAAGCDIVRLAVPDVEAALALVQIRKAVKTPLVADIHFDSRLAILSLDAGIDGLRINPGNIGSVSKVKEVIRLAAERNVPIRIGVNAGSLEKSLLARYGKAAPEALVESALRHVHILEDLDYREIKISVKASDVSRTVQAYRLLSEKVDYPLHLGVTEAGTFLRGTVSSSVALGVLLSEGIGDTIRISLAEPPHTEVLAGLTLLRSLNLRDPGPTVIACPTCGRAEYDAAGLARQVEAELAKLAMQYPDASWPVIAVMGCMVNGPGEAREADIAVAGGKGRVALYLQGRHVVTLPEENILPELLEHVREYLLSACRELDQKQPKL